MFGKRILILVPHPDDEVVACAATIGRAQAEGAEIFALYLTHGCIARETLWPWQRKHYESFVTRRRTEAESTAKFLGITPVGWSSRPARHLWRQLPETTQEIQAVIAAHAIDQLWVPAYEGGNADHDGLNAVGSLLAKTFSKNRSNSSPLVGEAGWGGVTPGDKPQNIQKAFLRSSPFPNPPHEGEGIAAVPTAPPVLEFAEYNFFNDNAHSQAFPHPNGTEQTVTLTPAEQEKKRAALAFYKSEKHNLNYVRTDRECYRPLADYNYSRRPHPGTLWYERFQWVPFRHPRVDFTKAGEVSESISSLIGDFK